MIERCRHGHPWNKANTKWMKHSVNGHMYRQCRTCAAALKKKRYACDPVYREKQKARVLRRYYAGRTAYEAIMNMIIGGKRPEAVE